MIEDYREFKKTLERGVKMRMVTEKHKDDEQAQKLIEDLEKSPLLK